ncbi:MAG: MCE family protein [Bacteroidales bacterium]|nr:MCE family protein [Bacteroidales bacterium]
MKSKIIIGSVFVVAIAILIIGVNYLKGIDFFNPDNTFYAVYPNVSGLKVSNSVTINGYKVGQVKKISLKQDFSGVLVAFSVDKDFVIPDSTIAQIYSSDIMGTKAVKFILSSSTNLLADGDTLLSNTEKDLKEQVNAELLPLKRKTENLISSIDSAVTIVQNIFNEKTRENLSLSFESIKKTVKYLEETSLTMDTLMTTQRGKLSRIFTNIESISGNLKNNNEKLTNIINNFSAISDSLARIQFVAVMENAEKTLNQTNQIVEKINSGQGTIGMLINNDTLYNHLEKSAKDLDYLLEDIKQNPKRYLHFSVFDFGKTVIKKEE